MSDHSIYSATVSRPPWSSSCTCTCEVSTRSATRRLQLLIRTWL